MITEAYEQLFNKPCPYTTHLEYNRRLSSFNANITLKHNKISVHLNLQWKDIDNNIKIGLIQHLLIKLFKTKTTTPNISLYHNFVKNIPILTPKTDINPQLYESFQRVQSTYLQDLELPNLKWGNSTKRKLAHYNFHDDTITVSKDFQNAPQHLLDYLMYHELLHKKHQFEHKNGRSSYHSPQFRKEEALYPNFKQIDKEIHSFLRKIRKKPSFWSIFHSNI